MRGGGTHKSSSRVSSVKIVHRMDVNVVQMTFFRLALAAIVVIS